MLAPLNIKNLYKIIFIISVFSLIGAFYIEHYLNIKPCKLCIYQRYPYYFAFITSALALIFFKKNFWIYILIITFIISFLLSGYHVGIEANIFAEFSGCTSSDLDLTNKNEILDSLNSPLSNCKDINFKIFGMSLATINFIFSTILIMLCIRTIYNEKNK